MRFVLAVLLITSSCFAAAFGRVRGIVTDSFGKPVANAMVSFSGRHTKTGADGKYEFDCVQCCKTGIIIKNGSFKDFEEVYSIYQGENFFRHELKPLHEIRMKKETDSELEEMRIIQDNTEPVFEETKYKETEKKQLSQNSYWGDKELSKSSEEIARLIEETSNEIEIDGIIVSEQTGMPLANAVIAIGIHKEISGTDGKYHFPAVEKGTHSIVVSCHGYETKQTDYNFTEKCVLDFLMTAKQ